MKALGDELPEERAKPFRCRRIVEALRLGVVPLDCAADFTFGREAEAQAIDAWLSDADAGVMILRGEYGVGKTHMLHYAYDRALHSGHAVAFVQVSPNEAPFSHPKRLYHRLASTLRFQSPDLQGRRGFEQYVGTVVASGKLKDHKYFRELDEDPDDAMWDWISGAESGPYPSGARGRHYGNRVLPGMYSAATGANIYTYLLSGLSWAARSVLGLKGLVLLFDEAESIDSGYYGYQFHRGRNFIHALAQAANNASRLSKRDPETSSLTFCKWSRVPFIYKRPTSLKIVFATTPSETSASLAKATRARLLDLEPIGDGSRKQVFKHVTGLYETAHRFKAGSSATRSRMKELLQREVQTRHFVKGCVEVLDLVRHATSQAIT